MVRGKQGRGTCTDPDRNAAEGFCSLCQMSARNPVEKILGGEQCGSSGKSVTLEIGLGPPEGPRAGKGLREGPVTSLVSEQLCGV